MKGQVFIILTVFLLLGLILLRVSTRTITEKPESFLSENFLNMKNELTKTVDIALLKNESVATDLNQFISFSTDTLKQRGYVESVLYSINQIDNTTTVSVEASLSLGNDYLNESFEVERTVYD